MLPPEPLEVRGVLDKAAQIFSVSLETANQRKGQGAIRLHTDGRLGGPGVRGDAELPGAGLVLSRYPENVGEPLQQTFDVHLSVGDDVPEEVDRRERESLQTSPSPVFCEEQQVEVGLPPPHLLTRAQCELLISRRSTQ